MTTRRRRRAGLRLLSVDWDAFFPGAATAPREQFLLYDWSMKETPFFLNDVWTVRATSFLMGGLPLPTTSGDETGFWSRVPLAPNATLAVAESHASLASEALVDGVAEVVSVDAHHDCGYRAETALRDAVAGRWACDTWGMLYQLRGAAVDVRYPPWMAEEGRPPGDREADPVIDTWLTRTIDAGGPIDGRPFDRVFVCRSGCWVPPWCDDAFARFVAACPVPAERRTVLAPGTWPAPTPRAFALAEAEERAELFRQLQDPDSAFNRVRRVHQEQGWDEARSLAADLEGGQ